MPTIHQQLKTIGTPECREFANDIFLQHKPISFYLKSAYVRDARRIGHTKANANLRQVHKRLKVRLVGVSGIFKYVSVTVSDEDIDTLSLHQSSHFDRLFKSSAKKYDLRTALQSIQPVCDLIAENVSQDLRKARLAFDYEKSLSIVARLSDQQWWRKQLKTKFMRIIEQVLRELRFVSIYKKNPYVSKSTLTRLRQQRHKNKKLIDSMECVRDDGLTIPLFECVSASVSNPSNRRTEVMTRLSGTEQAALGLGYTGLFLTITCPSRFHATTRRGHRNPKYDGSTPRDANDYLNKVWQKIRATWAKKEIQTFGFRIAEPHHDGTPHWHLLMYVDSDQKDTLVSEFKKFALKDSPEEPGAQKYRVEFVEVDLSKGSATGYVAKYISKNIDGHSVEDDFEGNCTANEGAERVRAWASCWSIRQFQFIGSVSVTVWRELRRRIEGNQYDQEDIRAIRESANRGDWCQFMHLMGGATVRRCEAVLRIDYEPRGQNRYGEQVKKLLGLVIQAVSASLEIYIKEKGSDRIVTRTHEWKIQTRTLAVAAAPPH